MTPADAARILAVAAAFDRRTVGELDAHAWADALHDLNPTDCLEAARTHYRHTTDWLMPAHIRHLAAAARRDRLERERNTRQLRELTAASAEAVPPGEAHARVVAIKTELAKRNADKEPA